MNLNLSKKYMGLLFVIIIFFITMCAFIPNNTAVAQEYVPISETPFIKEGPLPTIEVYLNKIFVFTLGIAGLLAVINITMGGITYITSSSGGSTEAAKAKIADAIKGLLLILATYIILNAVNPEILKFNFLNNKELQPPEEKVGPQSNYTDGWVNKSV